MGPKVRNKPSGEEWMSSIEAAKYLGCSVSGLHYRKISGRIESVTDANGRTRYLRSALDGFLAKYGHGNVKRRTLSEEEEEAARTAASAFVKDAKARLKEAADALDRELKNAFESYRHNPVRLAELIRSHIHLSRRQAFVASNSVNVFLSCDLEKLYEGRAHGDN